MANYRISPHARADLERIWLYGLEHWGEEAADEYLAAFFTHFEELAQQPLLYTLIDFRPGYRRSICGKDSVYYRLDGDVVEIMAIIGHQDADKWL